MSLAVLARKTKEKQRLRTRGNFILNMTGRGNVLGFQAKSNTGNCNLSKPCGGKRARCCVTTEKEPDCCRFKHGGKPAPQMGYGVYLNRKSNGAYHPAGGVQCCTKSGATAGKTVWKQSSNISASEVIQNKKDATIECYNKTNNNSTLGSSHCASESCNGKNTYIVFEKYEMYVGTSNVGTASRDEYGYDNDGRITFGKLCPNSTLMGYKINTMEFEDARDDGYRYHFELSLLTNNENNPAQNPTQCEIKSIMFFDATDNSAKIYHVNNVSEFGAVNDNNIVRWRWNGGKPEDYWRGKIGKCLQVTIEVVKTKIYTEQCDVKKNICGCNPTDLVSYTRINHNRCTTTKVLPQNLTAGEQIAHIRASSIICSSKDHKSTSSGGSGPTPPLRTDITDANFEELINKYYLGTNEEKPEIIYTYGIIEEWDVSQVTYMSNAFNSSEEGNIPGVEFNADLSNWKVDNVTAMQRMFSGCNAFNSDLSSWNVSNVTNMLQMFYKCNVFNSDLSSWNVSNVTDMYGMFDSCKIFNSDISGWDVSNVTTMRAMFYNCEIFNSDLSTWTFNTTPTHEDWCTGAPICDDPAKYPQF